MNRYVLGRCPEHSGVWYLAQGHHSSALKGLGLEGLALAALGRVSGLCHTAAAGMLQAARYLTDNSITIAPTAAAAADLAFHVSVAQHAIRLLKALPPPVRKADF